MNYLADYYQEELNEFFALTNAFIQKYPKFATNLYLPEVQRLLQNYALLNAELQHRLQDVIPEIHQPLLNYLLPHFLAPIPSLSIVQLNSDSTKLMNRKTVNANTELKINLETGETCYCKTCYSVDLWPIKILAAKLTSQPICAPQLPTTFHQSEIKSCLSISLQCELDIQTFAQLSPNKLRFFINAEPKLAWTIQNLLLGHIKVIALATEKSDSETIFLDTKHIQQVGFLEEEKILPYEQQIAFENCLLNDFFIFPEKFLFFDLIDINEVIRKKFTKPKQSLHIYFYLNKTNHAIEKLLNKNNFLLNCTPIINLFSQTSQLIQLNKNQHDYLIPNTTEIHSIKNIQSATAENAKNIYKPLFNFTPSKNLTDIYFKTVLNPANNVSNHIDTYLIFTDEKANPKKDLQGSIYINQLCTNSDLPTKIKPITQLELVTADDVIKNSITLQPFTSNYRPFLKKSIAWQLIKHLSDNLLNASKPLEKLKEILLLYNFGDKKMYQDLSHALVKLTITQVTARNPDKRKTKHFLWRGFEIVLEITESKLSDLNIFLFGSVLEKFFSLYQSVNFFTQLTITVKDNPLYQWPPRAGSKPFI